MFIPLCFNIMLSLCHNDEVSDIKDIRCKLSPFSIFSVLASVLLHPFSLSYLLQPQESNDQGLSTM